MVTSLTSCKREVTQVKSKYVTEDSMIIIIIIIATIIITDGVIWFHSTHSTQVDSITIRRMPKLQLRQKAANTVQTRFNLTTCEWTEKTGSLCRGFVRSQTSVQEFTGKQPICSLCRITRYSK